VLSCQIAAALPYATSLSPGSARYPIDLWLQVSNLSNPFTNSLSEPAASSA